MATVTKPLALNESLNSTENTPRNIADVLADELDGIKQAINSQSGSGNGHIIQNSSGANMPSENTMQFVDAHLSDDSVGGKTKVETFKAVTEAEYSSETEDGAYIITDGDGATIGPASEDYVEVTADGEKTYSQLYDELYAKIDADKINEYCFLMRNDRRYEISNASLNELKFSWSEINISGDIAYIQTLWVKSSGSVFKEGALNNESFSVTNYSSSKPTSGTKFTLYYGNKKAVVDLQTTANRCWYDSNTTVKQKLDVKANASDTKIKKTTDASIAFSQAKEYVILVGSGTKGNVNISLSIYIPISTRTSTLTYWETSAAYNTGSQAFLQIAVSDTSVRDIGLYDGASLISDATYTYYYR